MQPANPAYSCWAVAASHRASRASHQRSCLDFALITRSTLPPRYGLKSSSVIKRTCLREKYAHPRRLDGTPQAEEILFSAKRLQKSTSTFLRGRFESG